MTFTADQFADLTRSCHHRNAATRAAALLNGSIDPDEVLDGRHFMLDRDERVMEALDIVLETYGVEALIPDGHIAPIGIYLNTGDTYSETVFLSEDGEFRLTTWGDEMEAWEREQAEEGMPY